MGWRTVLAIVAVAVAWAVLDTVIHGAILHGDYEATADLWRPSHEMMLGLIYAVTAISAVAFVLIYAWLVRPKCIAAGASFGLLYGIAVGAGMGFGSYAVMPIPLKMAVVWFVGAVVEALVGGIVAAAIVRPEAPTPASAAQGADARPGAPTP